MPVIGVIKDFNFESFRLKVKPLVIQFRNQENNLLVKYDPKSFDDTNELIAKIQSHWKRYAPDQPFEYSFLDQRFSSLLKEDARLSKFFSIASSISIPIACLGVLGVAAYTAEQRKKEVGHQKNIWRVNHVNYLLLGREFLILVALSFSIATTLSTYAMNEWLSGFEYRITLSPVIFTVVGLLSALVVWLVISFHFAKAARSNPIEAIKHD